MIDKNTLKITDNRLGRMIMSVKLLDNDAFYGYRVRRTVDAELFQEYFSLKSAGKRVRGAARNKIYSLAQE